jgi:integrase
MPSAHITKRFIAGLHETPDKAVLYWDDDLAGFGLRVAPGGTKAFVVQFRQGHQTKRKTLGSTRVLAVDRARKAAKDLLAAVRLDKALPVSRPNPPFGEALDGFLGFVRAKRAPRTAEDYEQRIEAHIRPQFGSKRIRNITRSEIERWHEGKANTPRSANYLLAILVAAFSYAVRVRIIDNAEHPARGIPKFEEKERRRYLTLDEIAAFGIALKALEKEQAVSPWSAAALRLLVLTGARSGEILNLKWEHVDLALLELNLPTSKTGAKKIKISTAAAQILQTIPRIGGVEWVIPGRRHGKRMTSLQRPFSYVTAKAGIQDIRIHDLRHSAASIATSAGVGLPIVGALLGQSQAYTTQRYSHIHDEAQRGAAEVIAGKVSKLLDVRPLRKAKREGRHAT